MNLKKWIELCHKCAQTGYGSRGPRRLSIIPFSSIKWLLIYYFGNAICRTSRALNYEPQMAYRPRILKRWAAKSKRDRVGGYTVTQWNVCGFGLDLVCFRLQLWQKSYWSDWEVTGGDICWGRNQLHGVAGIINIDLNNVIKVIELNRNVTYYLIILTIIHGGILYSLKSM